MRFREATLLGIGLMLSACVTKTEPVAVGKDTYLLTLNAHGGFQSDGELLKETIDNATEFCSRQGKAIEVKDSQSGGVQGWTPQHNQVTFRCVDRG